MYQNLNLKFISSFICLFSFNKQKYFHSPPSCFFSVFLLSDEKNGLSSRPPSTPTRQNSRRSEGGSDRGERAERSDRGEGSSIGGSASVLQRKGSGKDKTRLLSSNGTQSQP